MLKRLSLCVLALTCCAPVLAQAPIKSLSGDIRLTAPLDVTEPGLVLFRAQLMPRGGGVCEVTGTLKVSVGYADAPRRLEMAQGGTFVHCPGKAPALVTGQILPVAWTPPQMVLCSSRGSRSRTCSSYSATVEAGTTAKWITWHALTSDQEARK